MYFECEADDDIKGMDFRCATLADSSSSVKLVCQVPGTWYQVVDSSRVYEYSN